MNPNDLRKIQSKFHVSASVARLNQNLGAADTAQLQEPKAGGGKQKDGGRDVVHRTKGKGQDATTGGQYAVRVEVVFPNRRRQDLDGILSTIGDIIIRSTRRLLDNHPRDVDRGPSGQRGGAGWDLDRD